MIRSEGLLLQLHSPTPLLQPKPKPKLRSPSNWLVSSAASFNTILPCFLTLPSQSQSGGGFFFWIVQVGFATCGGVSHLRFRLYVLLVVEDEAFGVLPTRPLLALTRTHSSFCRSFLVVLSFFCSRRASWRFRRNCIRRGGEVPAVSRWDRWRRGSVERIPLGNCMLEREWGVLRVVVVLIEVS